MNTKIKIMLGGVFSLSFLEGNTMEEKALISWGQETPIFSAIPKSPSSFFDPPSSWENQREEEEEEEEKNERRELLNLLQNLHPKKQETPGFSAIPKYPPSFFAASFSWEDQREEKEEDGMLGLFQNLHLNEQETPGFSAIPKSPSSFFDPPSSWEDQREEKEEDGMLGLFQNLHLNEQETPGFLARPNSWENQREEEERRGLLELLQKFPQNPQNERSPTVLPAINQLEEWRREIHQGNFSGSLIPQRNAGEKTIFKKIKTNHYRTIQRTTYADPLFPQAQQEPNNLFSLSLPEQIIQEVLSYEEYRPLGEGRFLHHKKTIRRTRKIRRNVVFSEQDTTSLEN